MLYCAYGSNMNLKQMRYRCPNSHVICNGKLYGWKLIFNVHADIIETKNEDDVIPVVIWNIADEDLYALDMYEGYPTYYIRENVEVELENGKYETVTVYVMSDNSKGVCPPNEYYFNVIIDGCIDNGIDYDYVYKALDYSIENETESNQYTRKAV